MRAALHSRGATLLAAVGAAFASDCARPSGQAGPESLESPAPGTPPSGAGLIAASGGAPRGGSTSAGADRAPGSGPGVRWIGRVDTSRSGGGVLGRFAWSGSGFVATVSGPTVSVALRTEGTNASPFFQPVVDGTPGPRFSVPPGLAHPVVLATGLGSGPHIVEVRRESEAMFGETAFLGFTEGRVGAPPPAKGRLIEIVGDSISAGYGNLGQEVHGRKPTLCHFTLETESAYDSYGAVLARTLDAEASIVARSGWGMYRDLGGNTSNVVPSLYTNALGTKPFPVWSFARQPDAVVVNLGTNDSARGDPGPPYEEAYVAFLQTVRARYPRAWIFLTIGPMTMDPMLAVMRKHLAHVVVAAGDPRVTSVEIAPQGSESTGCDYHPSAAEDVLMADALASAMRDKLGWSLP